VNTPVQPAGGGRVLGLVLSLLVGGWLNRRRNPTVAYNPASAHSGRARTLVRRRTLYQDDLPVPARQPLYQDEPLV